MQRWKFPQHRGWLLKVMDSFYHSIVIFQVHLERSHSALFSHHVQYCAANAGGRGRIKDDFLTDKSMKSQIIEITNQWNHKLLKSQINEITKQRNHKSLKSQINVQNEAPVVGERSIPPKWGKMADVVHGWGCRHKSGDCEGCIPKNLEIVRHVFLKI